MTHVKIQFLGTAPSSTVEAIAREKARKLSQFCNSIVSCHVSIELAHKHQHQGRQFAVRIDLALPGKTLTINRMHDEDVHLALRSAFDGMRRQVEDAVRRDRDRRVEPPA